MAVTYEPIASVTLGSDTTTVTFSSIPGTYTDLVLVMQARSTLSGAVASFAMRVNSDTASNYSYTYVDGNGSSASSARASSQTEVYVSTDPAAVAATDSFGATVIHVMSYANTNVNKTVLASSSTSIYGAVRIVGLWRSTAAITSVSFRSNGGTQGNFKSGSTFSLYGIKAA